MILLRTGSAQALAGEIDPVRIMDEAIKDRVGVRRIAYDFVPALHGELRGDDGRTAAVSFLEDFEDVVTGGVERERKRKSSPLPEARCRSSWISRLRGAV